MRVRHIELPNGTGVKVNALGEEEMGLLVEEGRLQVVATNFVYRKKSYTLYFSPRTKLVYGVENGNG